LVKYNVLFIIIIIIIIIIIFGMTALYGTQPSLDFLTKGLLRDEAVNPTPNLTFHSSTLTDISCLSTPKV
jgi:hypothetical protein